MTCNFNVCRRSAYFEEFFKDVNNSFAVASLFSDYIAIAFPLFSAVSNKFVTNKRAKNRRFMKLNCAQRLCCFAEQTLFFVDFILLNLWLGLVLVNIHSHPFGFLENGCEVCLFSVFTVKITIHSRQLYFNKYLEMKRCFTGRVGNGRWQQQS